jgi:hypothetical protein
MPAKLTRPSSSLSIKALVSALIGFHTGFSTNCRRQSLQANFAFPLWIYPFLITRFDPQRGQLGIPRLFLAPPAHSTPLPLSDYPNSFQLVISLFSFL